MPLRFYPGDRPDSLLYNQFINSYIGTSWLGGGDASIVTDSADPMEISVESASIRIGGGDPINVDAGTVEIPEGDASWPRRDILYAGADGELDIEPGQAQPQLPDGSEVEPGTKNRMAQLAQPVPPDVLRYDAVPLWEIFVPEGADSAEELTALEGRALRDRRQKGVTVEATDVSHSSLTDLLDDDHPQYLLNDGTRKADPSIVGGGNDGQVITSDGSDSQWNSPSFVYQLTPTELAASGEANDTFTEFVWCPNGTTILGLGVADENGDPQTAIEAEVEVVDSSKSPQATTDRYESYYELYGSATKVRFSMTNTSGSIAQGSAELWFRRHAPF